MTFDIILPVTDAHGNIVDWKIVSRVMAASMESALRFSRQVYGLTADVRGAV